MPFSYFCDEKLLPGNCADCAPHQFHRMQLDFGNAPFSTLGASLVFAVC